MTKRKGHRGGGKKSKRRDGPDGKAGGKASGKANPSRSGRFSKAGADTFRPGESSRSEVSTKVPGLSLGPAVRATEKALAKWREIPVYEPPDPNDYDADLDIYLDPWQKQAVENLHEGRSVVVDAPTTAGKTRVVEAFFKAHLNNPHFRAAYTTPVKSLSNDKLREFREMFGKDNVGIATGDLKENLSAPIVVATLESYRNSLLGVEPDLGRTLVVFDEYHYLQDVGRGSAWEEAMILTPPTCQLLLLSASVANPEDFAEWIEKLGQSRDCRVVSTPTRPVPLVDMVFLNGHWLLVDELPETAFKQLNRKLMELPIKHEELVDSLVGLPELGLTPCIVYAGRRLACETLAQMITRKIPTLPEDASAAIGKALMEADKECGSLKFMPASLRRMLQVYGVGFHHSGMAAPVRIAVEILVKRGLLKFCTATMGLSLGINFAVRSTLISDYTRPGEGGLVKYDASECLQMLGRAGRRGRDQVGFSLWSTREAYRKLGNAKRQPVESRLRSDPTTFLGLIGRDFNLRAIENFYQKSFLGHMRKGIDFSLVTWNRVQKKSDGKPPCVSPAEEYSRFVHNVDALCEPCPLQAPCHEYIAAKEQNPLSALHLHLHHIEALNAEEKLTPFGSLARYFPQAGGLLFARYLAEGVLHEDNLVTAAELAAGFALSWFKEPGGDPKYRWPFNIRDVQEELQEYYPYELFPEIYDPPFGARSHPVLRDFNPRAGYFIHEWAMGADWKSLVARVASDRFGEGDSMSLVYRTATYLQSIAQATEGNMAQNAKELRSSLLRAPLDFVLTT